MTLTFDGVTYETTKDRSRLIRQANKVWNLMKDERWRTLQDISESTGAPVQSVGARLRDFRKDRWGNHQINRKRIGPGLNAYQLIVNC